MFVDLKAESVVIAEKFAVNCWNYEIFWELRLIAGAVDVVDDDDKLLKKKCENHQ